MRFFMSFKLVIVTPAVLLSYLPSLNYRVNLTLVFCTIEIYQGETTFLAGNSPTYLYNLF